ATDDQGVPQGVGEKRLNEPRVDHEHEDDNRGGESHEQGHGEASLGGVDADLAQDLKAFANDVREVVKNLGEIAAGFALQHHRRHEELNVDQRNTVGEVEQGVAYREPEFLFFVELAEFSGNGFGDFVGNHFESGGKGVSGANGAGEGIDGLGKLLLKFPEALGPQMRGIGVGKKKTEESAHPTENQVSAGDERDEGEAHGRHGAQHEEVSGANVQASLSQHFLQHRNSLRAAQKGVESGDAAEHFVAKQSDFGGGLLGWFLNGGEAIAENAGLGLALIEQRHAGKDRQRDHDKYQQGDKELHR